jgi:C4-dicarboxylate-binding protein DctP
MLKKITNLFATFTAVTLLSFFSASAAPIVVKFSHVVAENTPKGQAALKFKELAEKKLPGKVEIQVFPSSQLFGDAKEMEALLLNDVQIIAPSLSKFDRYTKKIQVFDLPFLFKDANAALKFENSKEGKALLKSMESKGLIGLNYWANGMRHFSANKDFRLPSELKGLKFRIQPSDVYEAMIKALNASGQKMAFAEVYQALQTGVVDGQENSFSNIYSQKFHEVQKTIVETNHGILDYMVVVNAKWWNGLPKDVQKGLSEAMAEATKFNNDIAKQKNDDARKAIEASGKAKIVKLTSAQLEEWKKAMAPVYKQFEADVGADLIKAAQAASVSKK